MRQSLDRLAALHDEPFQPAAVPGRRTLTASIAPRLASAAVGTSPPAARVQLRAVERPAGDPFALHLADDPAAIAEAGLRDSPGALPHLDTIQRAFGRHDVSATPAVVGGSAAEASASLGARAYAADGRVGFASSPDLFTAAHEAAHVVQQRGGVQLAGGVGARGDVYEQHADRVAALVVSGQSAEAALDEYAGQGGGGHAVQRAEVEATSTGAAPAGDAGKGAGDASKGELILDDLCERGRELLVGAIGAAAPSPGTKIELKANLRCPTEIPGLWLSGKVLLSVDHTASSVQTTMSGGLGIAVGGPGGFADLLATLSLQGTGADATRSAEMLLLAVEGTVRAIPDAVFMAMSSRMLVVTALIALASKLGARPADLLADVIWGKGHAAEVMANMKDGESAKFEAGGELGGEAGPGGNEGSVEGSAGLTERHTIEKKPGKATSTKNEEILVVAAKLGVGPVEGAFKLESPLAPGAAAKLELSGTGKVSGADLGDLAMFAMFVTGVAKEVRAALSTQDPANGDVAELSRALDTATHLASTAIQGAVDAVGHALEDHGVGKAKTALGLEAAVKFDFGSRTAAVVFSLVDGAQLAVPGGEGKASYKQKTELVRLPFALTP